MDLQKTKIYLDKLNREFNRMSKDPETIVRLDIDIMASYVRELYDAVLSEEAAPAQKHEHHVPKKQGHSRGSEHPVEVTPPPTVSAPPPVVEAPPPPIVSAPPVVEAAPPPPVVQEVTPAPAPPVEPKPTPAVPKASEPAPGGIELLFEEKQARELSEKLSELPIADLKKAIALNDRLLLTSELFAGDGKAFETAINDINGMANFEAAQAYLVENCVVRYAWTDKKRLDTAKHFIKLVRRRFK